LGLGLGWNYLLCEQESVIERKWNNGNGLFVEVMNYVYFGLFGWIVWSTRLRHNEFKLPFNMLPILPCIYTGKTSFMGPNLLSL
jgi:hypothetical protein